METMDLQRHLLSNQSQNIVCHVCQGLTNSMFKKAATIDDRKQHYSKIINLPWIKQLDLLVKLS